MIKPPKRNNDPAKPLRLKLVDLLDAAFNTFTARGYNKFASLVADASRYVRKTAQFYDGCVDLAPNLKGERAGIAIASHQICVMAFIKYVMIRWQTYLHGELSEKSFLNDLTFLNRILAAYKKGDPVVGDVATGYTLDIGYTPMNEKPEEKSKCKCDYTFEAGHSESCPANKLKGVFDVKRKSEKAESNQ